VLIPIRTSHAAAVINPLGVLLSSEMFPATAAGYRALLAWVSKFGTVRRAGVECTGSYGAALARHLRAAGVEVIEVNQPDKATRRRRGKTDTIDAESAARAVLRGRATGSAKASDGPVEMLRMFTLAKASALKARTQTINQLKAVLVAADPALREALSGLSNTMLIPRCTQLELDTPRDTTSAAAYTLRLLARRILALTSEIRDLEQQITAAITHHTPTVLTRRGIGPHNAAALLITAGDNPNRLRSEASLHRPVRRQPAGGVLGPNQPSPTQSRRRPSSQRRALPHRPVPAALGHPHPQLPHPPHHRRQNPPRSHPLPQAIHRPRDLPDPHDTTRTTALSGLTSIGASAPEEGRPRPVCAQRPAHRRARLPGIRSAHGLTRRPRLLRAAQSPRHRAPRRPAPAGQPARRHPARLPQNPHPLRRSDRMVAPCREGYSLTFTKAIVSSQTDLDYLM
jgi:transposase